MKRLALALLCLATPAYAEINMADSIEWQTADSDVVVRGFVVDFVLTKSKVYDVTLQITESIKGGKKQSLHFATREAPGTWKSDKTDLLVFLVDGTKTDDKDLGKLALVPRPIHGDNASIYVLGTTKGYTTSFKVVVKDTDVLAAVRPAARSTATKSHRVDVPWGTPAAEALYGGSTVWMTLPVDSALEALAIAWLADKSVMTREEGALALAEFRSDANIARMKKLLADTDFVEITYNGGPTMKRYAVRAAAHDALVKWHVAHDTPLIEEPKTK